MAEGTFAEGENKISKWASFKKVAQSLFRRPPVANNHEVSPVIEKQVVLVPPGSGYAELIESPGTGEESNSALLREQYPRLLQTIDSDASLTVETKKILLDELNAGNKDVIAVLAKRFLVKVERKNKPTKNMTSLAETMEGYFIDKRLADDHTPRSQNIKYAWAKHSFDEAVFRSGWQPTPVPRAFQDGSREDSVSNIPVPINTSPQK